MTRARDVANIDGLLTAKGDIYAATAAGTPSRLGVGTNGQALLANSSTATGLEWATPASGGMTLLSTTSVGTGSTVTISSISQSYKSIYFVFREIKFDASDTLYVRINGNSASASHATLIATGTTVASGVGTTAVIGQNTSAIGLLNGTMTIPDYANTTLNSKPFTADTTSINIGSSAGPRRITLGSAQSATADAYVGVTNISSVVFGLTAAAFVSGTILMYGVN